MSNHRGGDDGWGIGKGDDHLGEGVRAIPTSVPSGVIAEEAAWQAVVLILKGVGDYRGIGLVELIWKAVSVIINRCFTVAINYHDFLHVFRAGCGTGTATTEVKLLEQVEALKEAVFHAILLGLHKAYNALDRSGCLGVLEGFGVGPRSLCILQRYWARLNMVARVGGYYRAPLRGKRGVTQVDPLFPTIFNVVVDAVVCHWESLLVVEQEGGDSRGDKGYGAQTAGKKIPDGDDGRQWAEEGNQRLKLKAAFLYAENGMVSSTYLGWL